MNSPMTRLMTRTAVAMFCLAFATTASAGPGQHREGRWSPPSAEERVAWMTEELDLNDAQSAQLLEVMQRADAEREALREKFEEGMKPEICAIHDRTTEDIRAILDAGQAAEFEQLLERRSESAERRGRRGPPPFDC